MTYMFRVEMTSSGEASSSDIPLLVDMEAVLPCGESVQEPCYVDLAVRELSEGNVALDVLTD